MSTTTTTATAGVGQFPGRRQVKILLAGAAVLAASVAVSNLLFQGNDQTAQARPSVHNLIEGVDGSGLAIPRTAPLPLVNEAAASVARPFDYSAEKLEAVKGEAGPVITRTMPLSYSLAHLEQVKGEAISAVPVPRSMPLSYSLAHLEQVKGEATPVVSVDPVIGPRLGNLVEGY